MTETNPQSVPNTSEQISKNLAAPAQAPSTQTKLPDLAHQPVSQTAVPPVTPSIPNPPTTLAHYPPVPPLVPNPPVPTGNFPHPTGQVDPHTFPVPTATQVAAADKFMEQVWPSILAYVTKIPRFDASFMGQPHIQQLVGAFAAGLRREFINGNL
jgi:hypothetical protein